MAADSGIKKLVGYVRVSSVAGRDSNIEAFHSPVAQRESMERWAATKYEPLGHEWLEWIVDLDSSAISQNRPMLDKASDLAIANGADLVVYSFSRYSRNLPEGMTALESLKAKGVLVRSATEGSTGGTAEEDLTLAMFMMLNQYQLAKVAESWRNTIKRNKDEGRWHGIVPFGYRRATPAEKKKLGRTVGVIVPDERNEKYVKRIFTMYAEGKGLFQIGQIGVKNKWFMKIGTAKEILRSPVYIGMLPVKEYVPAINRRTHKVRHDNHRRPLKEVKPDSEIGFVPGKHKAIISRELWDKVQARLANEKRAPRTKYAEARYFAARRVRCAACGTSLNFQDRKAGKYLTCRLRTCEGKPGSVKVNELEELVTAFMHELPVLIKPAIAKSLRERGDVAADLKVKMVRLDREIAKLSDSRATMALIIGTRAFTKSLTAKDAEAALNKVRGELENKETERMELVAAEADVPKLHEFQETALAVGKIWDLAGNTRRVEILEVMGMEIHIKKARKYNDSLDGRVVVKTSLPLGDLNIEGPAKKKRSTAKSGPPKRPRLREKPPGGG